MMFSLLNYYFKISGYRGHSFEYTVCSTLACEQNFQDFIDVVEDVLVGCLIPSNSMARMHSCLFLYKRPNLFFTSSVWFSCDKESSGPKQCNSHPVLNQ